METMTPKASARKFRPNHFGDVVGQQAVVTTLQNAIMAGSPAQAYLLCGPRGTGKTTLARLVAKALNCESRTGYEPCGTCPSCKDIAASRSMDVIEIDGASHRGIDEIRKINETANYTPSPGKTKVYIIDEVHMLTREAFNALLKTLEEPPAHVMFIFATTEPQKLPATIISRCQRFFLERIETALIKEALEKLCPPSPLESLALIAAKAEGGMRDALSLFDQAYAFDPELTLESVQKALGIASEKHLFALDKAKKKGSLGFAFELTATLLKSGQSAKSFLEALLQHLRALMLVYTGSDLSIYLQDKKEYLDDFKASSRVYTQSECLSLIDFVIDALVRLPHVLSEQALLEIVLLKVIGSSQSTPLTSNTKEIKPPLKETPPKAESPQIIVAPVNETIQTPTKDSIQDANQANNSVEAPNSANSNTQEDMRPPKLKAKHDALIRFAAVELEANLQTRSP